MKDNKLITEMYREAMKLAGKSKYMDLEFEIKEHAYNGDIKGLQRTINKLRKEAKKK